jgi:hypothetical protein
MTSRQMEFYSDQKTAVANQSVLVTHADGYAQAGKAVLFQDKGEILLEGEPRVFTTQGDFSGRRLKLNLLDNRFEGEGGVEVTFYPTPQSSAPRPQTVQGPPTGQGTAAGPAPEGRNAAGQREQPAPGPAGPLLAPPGGEGDWGTGGGLKR